MIVNIRLEVTEEQRRELTRRLRPNALSRLATRSELSSFVVAKLRELDSRPQPEEKAAPEQPTLVDSPRLFASPQATIEKDGTGIKAALASVTNAMHSMANVQRYARAAGDGTSSLAMQASTVISELWEQMVAKHDKEQAA